MIQGSASLYASNPEGARRTYKYFTPGLSSARRLFAELNRDSRALSQFLVQGSRALGAIAERRDDLSALTQNANEFLGAIASEQSALEASLEAFPPALRQANTTFVNVRALLDDLTPLVNEFKPATKDLAPFLRKLRPVAERSVPVFRNLRLAINRSGPTNDLTDSLRELPRIERKASRAVPRTIAGLDASQPVIEFARPYMPDLMGFLSKFAEVTAFYDANGHYARVSTSQANLFHYCETGDTNPDCAGGGGPYATGQLAPIPPSQQFDDLEFGNFTRCPGGATQPIPGSNPFTDDGRPADAAASPRTRSATPPTCRPDHEEDRRHSRAPGHGHAGPLRPGGERGRGRVRGPGDLRQRRLPGPRRGGAGRRRHGRLGVVRRGDAARRAGARGRQRPTPARRWS